LVKSTTPTEPDQTTVPQADISKILTPEIVNVPGPSVRPKTKKWLQPARESLHAMKTRDQQRQAAEQFTKQLITSWTLNDTSTEDEGPVETLNPNSENSQNSDYFHWPEMIKTSTPINRGAAEKLEETATEELIFLGSDELLTFTDRSAAAIHFLDNLPIYQTPAQRELNVPVTCQRRCAACNVTLMTAEEADQDNNYFCDYLCKLLGSYNQAMNIP
jgi:hypothetical protein